MREGVCHARRGGAQRDVSLFLLNLPGWNSGLSNLSASSMTIILHLLRLAMPLSARSCTLPGVPS